MQELREGGRVDVDIKPVCIFLFKDGTPFSLPPLDPLTDPNQQAPSFLSFGTTTSNLLSLSDEG